MLKSFLLAFSTLTIIPIPYTLYEDADGKRASYFFPLAGLLIGALISLVGALSVKFFSIECTALLVLFFSIYLSRAFHLDGFADCADAFWSSRSKEKKVEIMKDSRIGVMGVVALIFLLGAKFLFICEIISRQEALFYLLLFPFCGRCSMNFHMLMINPVEKGLGTFFWNSKTAYLSLAFLLVISAVFLSWQKSLIIFLILVLVAVFWSIYVRNNVEKGNGDSLGASCEWGELFFLFCAAELFPYVP